MFPYCDNPMDCWVGYFTSRQSAKKQVRDGQANVHASNRKYAQRVVNQEVSELELKKIMALKNYMLDWMGVYQHHDAVAGTAMQHVADNYIYHLDKSMKANNWLYAKYIAGDMGKETGHWAMDFETCVGAQNDTVVSCPVANHTDAEEFIVAVHNPSAHTFK